VRQAAVACLASATPHVAAASGFAAASCQPWIPQLRHASLALSSVVALSLAGRKAQAAPKPKARSKGLVKASSKEAPKRAKSAFIFFCAEKRSEVQGLHRTPRAATSLIAL
jgi:hypothetical protein